MARREPLCDRYDPNTDESGHHVPASRYRTVVDVDALPRATDRDDHCVSHGYAVHVDAQWFFFDAVEPALAFGRAARMSVDCSSYGVYAAARETQFCHRHGVDEVVLLHAGDRLDRKDNEVEMLTRFVQGVTQRRGSAHWHAPSKRASQ